MQNSRSSAQARWWLWLGLALLLGGIVSPRTARCQDFAAAGAHFAAAQDAFAQGQFKQAAAEYQAAYDITRDPALLSSIGESYQRASDYRRAAENYRAYLKEVPQATDRAEIERRLRELDAALAAPPPGVGTPGAAQGPGAGPASPGAQVGPGAQAGQGPQAGTPSSGQTPPKSTGPTSSAWLRTAAWGGVALTTALLTAGAVVGLGAQNRSDELNRRTRMTTLSGQPPVFTGAEAEAYNNLYNEGQSYNTGAIVCLSVAGAAAVATTVLFVLDGRARKATSAPDAQGQKAAARPARSATLASGLALGWRF